MPFPWYPGFVRSKRRDGDKTRVCAADNHARRQESHMPVVAICVAIVADFVGRGTLEVVIWVFGVAELASIESAQCDRRR
jgi:hypothetical protein